MDTKKYSLTYLRHDPIHCSAPGLFRGLKRGERKQEKLDITYQHGPNTVRFVGFEPLGADDLRHLQGLCAMASKDGKTLTPSPSLPLPSKLRDQLACNTIAQSMDAIVAKCSIAELLLETGMAAGGASIRNCKASLVRLANITILTGIGESAASFHLLSFCWDDNTGDLWVALNPLISKAILGTRYTRVDMAEIRALRSDASRLIHQRLCGWIRPSKTETVKIETLSCYVWPDHPTASLDTQRQHRMRIRQAAMELKQAGWAVTLSRDACRISRPA